MAMHGHSEACCTIPPVEAEYKEKGTYIDIQGMKTYSTGPSSASTAILIIFDIFGFYPQTLQGADILATAGDTKYRVYMPDWFLGKPFPKADFPPDTDAKKEALGKFFQGPANPQETAKKLPSVLKDIEAAHGGITKWGALGMCWGGKIVSLTAGSDTPFAFASEVHPAMVDAGDAKKVSVPMCMLASGDEDEKDVAAFEKELTVPHHVETFKDMVHGWMAARADLKDDKVVKEYKRGYETLLSFYHKHG